MSSIARQFNRYGNRLRNLMLDIKFEHSVFALPFAILAAFLVSDGVPDLIDFIWIVVAMVGLRTTAMGANRLIDAEIDRRNPRTAGRPLAARKVGRREVIILIVVSVVLFGVAVANLDPITWYLSPIPVSVDDSLSLFQALYESGALRDRTDLPDRSASGRVGVDRLV